MMLVKLVSVLCSVIVGCYLMYLWEGDCTSFFDKIAMTVPLLVVTFLLLHLAWS